MPLDGGDEEQRSGTVHLEDLDFNEKKNSSSSGTVPLEDLEFNEKENSSTQSPRFLEEQRSGTMLLEDLEFNEKENSSTQSPSFPEDGSKKKKTRFEGKIIRRRVGVRVPA